MRKIFGATLCAVLLTAPAGAANFVKNPGFAAGIDPWWKTPMSLKMSVVEGTLCMNVPGGTVELWDVIIGQNDVPLKTGVKYRFSFKAQAKPNATIRALVQIPMPPWTPYASIDQELTAELTSYSLDFTPAEGRKNAQVAFQFGGGKEPWILCLDDVAVSNLK
jgi:endoglucanase